MKYYGDENKKRLRRVCVVKSGDMDSASGVYGFLRKKGLFEEYIASVNATKKGNRTPHVMKVDDMDSFKFDDTTYWYGVERGLGCDTVFYEELPDIYSDEIFHWKRNKKYGTLECVVEDGAFEFLCIYKENDETTVDVKYVGCENRHKNKVTIATIEIYNATNDEILCAIRQWKTEFKEKLNVG